MLVHESFGIIIIVIFIGIMLHVSNTIGCEGSGGEQLYTEELMRFTGRRRAVAYIIIAIK